MQPCHALQLDWPVCSWNVSTGQSLQAVEPVLSWNLPAAHASHMVVLRCPLAEPVEHGTQEPRLPPEQPVCS